MCNSAFYGLRRQIDKVNARLDQTRQNLEALKKDPRATALRARINKRLEGFAAEGDKLGRQMLELERERLELKVALEDAIEGLDIAFSGK